MIDWLQDIYNMCFLQFFCLQRLRTCIVYYTNPCKDEVKFLSLLTAHLIFFINIHNCYFFVSFQIFTQNFVPKQV